MLSPSAASPAPCGWAPPSWSRKVGCRPGPRQTQVQLSTPTGPAPGVARGLCWWLSREMWELTGSGSRGGILVPNRTWEVQSQSSGLKAASSECQLLRGALAADRFFAPSGLGWLVLGRLSSLCLGRVSMPPEAFAAGRQGPVEPSGLCPGQCGSLVTGPQAGQTQALFIPLRTDLQLPHCDSLWKVMHCF